MCFLSPIPEKILSKSVRVYEGFQRVDELLDLLLLNVSKKNFYYVSLIEASKTSKKMLKEDLESMWSNEAMLNKIKRLVSLAFNTIDTGKFFICLKTIKEEGKE